MAVAYRSASNSGRAAGGNLTATEPAGATEGDLLVAVFAQDNAAATLALPDANWTEIGHGNDGSLTAWIAGWIQRPASAPNLTFQASGTQYRECVMVCVAAGGFDAASIANGSSSNADAPSATATTASDLAVAMTYFYNGFNSAPTAPTGYTGISSAWASGGGGGAAYRALSASGAENPSTFGSGNGSGPWVAITLLAKDAVTAEQDSTYKLGRVVSAGVRLT